MTGPGPGTVRVAHAQGGARPEGTAGRVDEVRIQGDRAVIRVLKSGLNSSPGVTRIGRTAYAIEGKIGYLVDPALRGKDPGPFLIHTIPLP